jgi:hypothetical protein
LEFRLVTITTESIADKPKFNVGCSMNRFDGEYHRGGSFFGKKVFMIVRFLIRLMKSEQKNAIRIGIYRKKQTYA